MGIRDWLSEQSTAVTVLVLIVVVPIVLLVLAAVVIAVLFVLFAILGTFVLGVGEEVDTSVQAGASVSFDEEAGEVAVTFTSNQNAEYLLVEVAVEGGAVGVVDSSGDVTNQGEAIRLGGVGSKVVLGKMDPDSNPTVTVTVSAVGPEGDRTVISRKEGQL